MKARTASRLAWSLFAAGMVLSGLILVLGLARGDAGTDLTSFPDDLVWFLSFVLFVPVGALIALRHPSNPVGWLMAVIGLSTVASYFAYEYAALALVLHPGSLPGGAAMAWMSIWTWAPSIALFPLLRVLFPTGRPPSRWWLWVGGGALGWLVAFGGFALALWPYRGVRFLADDPNEFAGGPLATVEAIIFGLYPLVLFALAAALVSVIIGFRRSHGVERQQLKWIAYVAALGAAHLILFELVLLPLGFENRATVLIGEILAGPGGFPIAAGIAILKYRLFDIDVIINRTVVYGALTLTLGLVYLGGVIGLANLLRVVADQEQQDNGIAVAASTLAVAAMFRPARARIQAFIDRRFYRRKYDAAKTLEDFSARLRDEVGLDALTTDLLTVVDETVQPAHASLWLRPGATTS